MYDLSRYPTSVRVRLTATMLLANYVALVPGVPKRLHFTDDYVVDRRIRDKESDKLKPVRSRVFWVDEEDGEPVAKTFSILSQKLDAIMEPYLKDQDYLNYDFIITKMGDGFYVDWNVQPIRRPEA